MPTNNTTYTYRCGQKVALSKNPNQFVVRSLPKEIKNFQLGTTEQVSSASTRITISSEKLESAMNTSRGFAPTHHAYELEDTGEEFLITDRIFVRFKKATSLESLNEFRAKYSLVLKNKYSSKEYLFQLTDYSKVNPVKLVVMLTEKEATVKSAGHDLNRRILKYEIEIPSDPAYLRQWHLHDRLNDPDFDPISSSRCEDAWMLLDSYGDPDVVIAVSDDGCRLDHDDFNSLNKFRSWGFFQGVNLLTSADVGANTNSMYQSGANHGTSCCGVIAGEVDAVKTVGAAPGCQLLPIKWESEGPRVFISDSKLITALEFISDKVDVMSNSWGSSPSGVYENEVINKIRSLSTTGGRRGKGIVFLWAAGNDGCPIEHQADIDVPYTSGVEVQQGRLVWVGVRTARRFRHNMADLSGVMYVAALASTGKRSHYSNYGTGISICAPTSNVHTYRRLIVRGLGITTATGEGTGITHQFGGTSSATPLVAGIAALVISANPDLSAGEVISILKLTASKNLNFQGYPKTPSQSFNLDTSWDVSPISPFDSGTFIDNGIPEGTWSPWFGHGNVDASEAVREAISRRVIVNSDSFQGSSAPALDIPDINVDGITDSITCPNTGELQSISLDVNITHTYIGDLIVSLKAPSGKSVNVHQRSGGPADNLVRIFDLSNSSALTALLGEQINGDWQLTVKDMASRDIGTLNDWAIRIEYSSVNQIVIEENPGERIPDNTAGGIERILNIARSGTIEDMEISIDITHTYIGDLTVELTSPRTGTFLLHNRSGSNQDNIIKTYTPADTQILRSLQGKSIRGNWKLRVIDHANIDIGKLNHWKILFTL